MRWIWVFFLFLGVAEGGGAVVTGADRVDAVVGIVGDRKVGLVVNQTSVLSGGVHLLDTLLARGVDVVKVFALEHGFRGTAEAGEVFGDGRDEGTGLPVVSLYGKDKKPAAALLAGLDLIIFDIQDVGVRFYTYISSMHLVMEACAESGKDCVILDRPNPNDFVDGPVRKDGYTSFVGLDPIPVLHGLTVGELALMINGERWLAGGSVCRLTVVEMLDWVHGDPYDLPVSPSPNLPNRQAVRLYPSLGWFEATGVSVGRGTPFPFQAAGYPDKSFGQFTFTPRPMPGMDSNPLQKGKACYGVDLRAFPFEGGLSLAFFLDFFRKAGGGAAFFTRPEWFDLLAGCGDLRTAILSGMTEDEIRRAWQDDLSAYKAVRRRYLLYADDRVGEE